MSRRARTATRRPALRTFPGSLALLVLAAGWSALAAGCSDDTSPEREARGQTGERVGGGPSRPRNVVLFVVDTLRADRLGCYGYPRDTSPNLDELAARGTLYEDNHSQASWTVPSMISMMTGQYVTQREKAAPRAATLLAERLSRAGFVTAAFVGNETLVHDRGFRRGFDAFEPTRGRGDAGELVGRFVDWYRARADELARARGFFAWIHGLDPHHPYHPRPDHKVFDGLPREDERELERRWSADSERVALLAPPADPLPLEESLRAARIASNRYDGEVRAADAALGRLVAFLEEAGELERTLIVFASDHGEKLWEHRRYDGELEVRRENRGGLPEGHLDLYGCGHRAWFHEELWNTPLVFAGPGFPAGARPPGLAANLDIYPTVLDAVGLYDAGDPQLQGESLLGGRSPRRERVYAYSYETSVSLDRDGTKLIEHSPRLFQPEPGREPVELFELPSDPGEQSNRALERPADVRARRADLEAWRARFHRDVDAGEETEADLDALRRLGYLEDGE